jgi:hypothetical protein
MSFIKGSNILMPFQERSGLKAAKICLWASPWLPICPSVRIVTTQNLFNRFLQNFILGVGSFIKISHNPISVYTETWMRLCGLQWQQTCRKPRFLQLFRIFTLCIHFLTCFYVKIYKIAREAYESHARLFKSEYLCSFVLTLVIMQVGFWILKDVVIAPVYGRTE